MMALNIWMHFKKDDEFIIFYCILSARNSRLFLMSLWSQQKPGYLTQ